MGRILRGVSPPEPPPFTLLQPAPAELAALRERLTAGERAVLDAFSAEKRREDWLLGRIAAKEEVRAACARSGRAPPDWQAFEIARSAEGAPRVALPEGPPLAISLSHGHGRACALALPAGAEGGLPGIDLERARPRRLGTLRFFLHPDEREPVLALPGGADPTTEPEGPPGPRDVAAVVAWALKEAAFKALQPPRGTGLLDVALALEAPHEATLGAARVAYRGKAAERADALGVRAVRAGWRRDDDIVIAWALAEGARLPTD